MIELLNKIFGKIINEKRAFKILVWLFIILLIVVILIYPIIDANFLYYDRTYKRIEIIQKIISIKDEDLNKDERIQKEYNRILDDMNNQDNNYLNNIFQKETSKGKNSAKFVSGAWLFFIVGLVMPFTKDKNSDKRFTFNNIMAGIVCIIIATIIGYVCMKIPNIINFSVNIVLYQIITIFLAYTIATSNKKS